MAQTETVPVATGQPIGRVADPCVMVIFGASGDLTRRKLIPALYNLAKAQLLSRDFAVIGIARSPMSSEDYRKRVTEDMKKFATGDVDPDLWEWFVRRIHYLSGNFDDKETYSKIKQQLEKLDKENSTQGNYFYYLATAPDAFGPIVESLAEGGLMQQDGGHWRRVIIEKPFGHDLESARALNQQLLKVADEKQIYRIDHYLGKETVQNILALRFANGIFEPIWNRRYIDHIQISVAETVGVEKRGGYYDTAGALRDMVPNHIMQLITLTAMEPPVSFRADAVRDEQSKILHAIQPLSAEEVLTRTVRGQYGEGVIDGQRVPAYRAEPGVPPDSRTETFVAMKLAIDNWRWADVPFYLRTGKRMPVRNTHIVIQFRRAPFVLFRDTPVENLMPNQLVLHIQPEEGISLRFAAKAPGALMRLGTVDMNFEYADYFGVQSSTGYERLLHDCMIGDQTLFQRADMVEAGWCVVSPVLDVWRALPPRNFPNYAAGTWGPKEADELLGHDGRRWERLREMILAGDIGGTNARLAYFQAKNGQLSLAAEGVYPSREHRGLDEIVAKFVGTQKAGPDVACFGVAGPVRNGKVETSNLPWTVESSRLASELKLPSAMLINDLEANAWGIPSLGENDLVPLNRVKGTPIGNQGVISAGTGLGEAGLYWDGKNYDVFACEGGHCDFAPRTELEIELFRYLAARFGHVSYERIVSGPGLVNVYRFLRDTGRGEEPKWLTDEFAQGDAAAVISRNAVAGKSVLAEHALDLWISIYGAEAGNLALKLMATGGVYLGGGIAPRLIAKLSGTLFMQAFVSKGRMQPLLESIPVKIITNDKIALYGAARYAVAKGTPEK